MHHALHIEEILLKIISYLRRIDCCPAFMHRHGWHYLCYANAHLARLARTCKAFKEPALNMIWAELDDLTPLVRCFSGEILICVNGLYSFKKHLGKEEWDIILCYAHRIRALPRLSDSFGLADDCIQVLSKPPSSSTSLFPNLRIIGLNNTSNTINPLIQHLIHPKVTNVSFGHIGSLGSALNGFGGECPLVTSFRVFGLAHGDTISGIVCRCDGLRSVYCPNVGLNVDALFHLSRLPCMFYLTFPLYRAVVDQVVSAQTSSSLLTFSALRRLNLFTSNLSLIGRFLRHSCFQALHELFVDISVQPTAADLTAFLPALQDACAHHSLTYLILRVYSPRNHSKSAIPSTENIHPYYITFDRLRLLTVFANMKSVIIDTHFGVDVNEHELLSLASSWPHLERFEVGENYDWASSSAITPDGFLRLLERCRSLHELYFPFDACGFTEIPQGHPWRGLRMPHKMTSCLHFLNSPIEEESVEALGVFFHVAPYPYFRLLTHWNGEFFQGVGTGVPRKLCKLYNDRWVRVHGLAYDLWKERRDLRYSIEARFSSSGLGCPS